MDRISRGWGNSEFVLNSGFQSIGSEFAATVQ
jgi:hypothetical protein